MTDDAKKPIPIPPKLRAAAERVKARARAALEKMDPRLREELAGSVIGSYEDLPDDYGDAEAAAKVALGPTPDLRKPSFLGDCIRAAFADSSFEAGRARGRLMRHLMTRAAGDDEPEADG